MHFEIIRICDRPELLAEAAAWFADKWGVPEEVYKESIQAYIDNPAGVPQWYVALGEDGRIIAGAGVIDNDFHERKDLSPNLCALYVEPDRRHRGIAGKLLSFALAEMNGCGFEELYLITDHTSFYERYGWRFIGMVKEEGGGECRMYRKTTAREFPVNKEFTWADEMWKAAVMAVSEKTLSIILCRKLDKEAGLAFQQRLQSMDKSFEEMSCDELEEIRLQNPCHDRFSVSLDIDGREYCMKTYSFRWWTPWDEEECDNIEDRLRYFGLNEEEGWLIAKASCDHAPAADLSAAAIRLTLYAEPEPVLGTYFEHIRKAGEKFPFIHPVTGQEHTLEVLDYEDARFPEEAVRGRGASGRKTPRCYKSLRYTITPPLSEEEHELYDCGKFEPCGIAALCCCNMEEPHVHQAASNPSAEPEEKILWRMKFFKKQKEDITVTLQ